MEEITEFYPGRPEYKTSVWITDIGRREFGKIVPDDLADMFQGQAEDGFQGYEGSKLRPEGDSTWAFGTKTWTARIAFFFHDPAERRVLIVGGCWDGKPGKGGGRPDRGDHVISRIVDLRKNGVKFVKRNAIEGAGGGAQEGEGKKLLPNPPPK